jgi:hypothetical protein
MNNKDNTPACSYDSMSVMISVLSAAFYVVTTPIIPANTLNIAFDTIRINRNSMYNSTTKQISSVSESGIYWLQMASAVPANSTTNMSLNGLTYPAVVYTNSSVYTFNDIMVADTLQYVSTSMMLTVSSQMIQYGVTNFTTVGTSLLGFRIDSIMSTFQVYFSLQLTHDIPGTNNGTRAKFDRVLLNVGGGWNTKMHAFQAPVAGIYFISFATSSDAVNSALMSIQMNGVTVGSVCVCDIPGTGPSHNGVQVARGALMLSLSTTDVITFKNPDSGVAIRGSPDGLTNAQGFLYNPVFITPVAWSVAKTTPNVFTGPISYLQFDTVTVSTNSVFNTSSSSIVTIPANGTYLIDMTAFICGNVASANCSGNTAYPGIIEYPGKFAYTGLTTHGITLNAFVHFGTFHGL